MPVWADTGKPPGPLNYRQIDELVAFLMATNEQTYTVRDEHLLDPKVDPVTGKVMTFTGWRDPDYKPAPGATPYPGLLEGRRVISGGGGSAAPSRRRVDRPECPGRHGHRSRTSRFDPTELTAPAGTAFTFSFDNQDAGDPARRPGQGRVGHGRVQDGVFPGAAKRDYPVPALAAGSYPFACSVHPNMTGTLTAE